MLQRPIGTAEAENEWTPGGDSSRLGAFLLRLLSSWPEDGTTRIRQFLHESTSSRNIYVGILDVLDEDPRGARHQLLMGKLHQRFVLPRLNITVAVALLIPIYCITDFWAKRTHDGRLHAMGCRSQTANVDLTNAAGPAYIIYADASTSLLVYEY